MGLADPHDPRTFTHFAKLNPDGSVAAIVEVADTDVYVNHPSADGNVYVDVTALRSQRIDVDAVVISTKVLEDARALAPQDQAQLKSVFRMEAEAAHAERLAEAAAVEAVADGGQ